MRSKNRINALIGLATVELLSIDSSISKNDILHFLSLQRDAARISHYDYYTVRNTLDLIDTH